MLSFHRNGRVHTGPARAALALEYAFKRMYRLPERRYRNIQDGNPMEIKETTTVEEAIKKSPAVAAVFKKLRLDCPSCRGARADTIMKVAINNGLELKSLLLELNRALKETD
ncbi:MAG TPA: hypothetical protein PLD92_11490 [Candidatus Omnitrophota bacterium]|nr:hypothetical protein [Candidatus Omnitrophota bacterium]